MSRSDVIGGTLAITGFVLVFFLVFFVLIFALCAVMIVSKWKIFTKANEEGWKSIIPVYNQIVLCQLTGTSPWWLLVVFVVGIVVSILSAIFPPFSLLSSAASIYFSVILNINLGRSFKKDNGFIVGMAILPIVFYPMLAFGKDEYKGIDAIEDPVMNFILGIFGNKNDNNQNNNAQPKEQSTEEKEKKETKKTTKNTKKEEEKIADAEIICKNCGETVSSKFEYCPNCGNEIK